MKGIRMAGREASRSLSQQMQRRAIFMTAFPREAIQYPWWQSLNGTALVFSFEIAASSDRSPTPVAPHDPSEHHHALLQ
jgi:hypothetical protein